MSYRSKGTIAAILLDNKNEQELEKIVEVDEDIVEDGEDDEDDEEEEEEEENNEEEKEKKLLDEYKSKYDDATRLAKKYLDGQLYIKAATKFSEAIDLASHIPSASKDILTLYNNRSAMYEKANEFQKALSDITVVLAMDIKHLKARSRRARIYEAQGKFREALNDYIFVMLLEQLTQRPSTNIYKVDEICKRVSKEDANVLLNDLKVKLDRPLPSKSYCKSFFEALPDIHFWREKSSLWTSKDDDGKIRDSGIDNSLADIQQVLKLTEALLFNNIIKEVRVAALLKLVQINTHSKSQLGQQTTEEDLTTNRLCVDEAKLLQPNNVTTLLLDADLSTVEGNLPLALEKVDKVIDIVGDSDALPYVIKANVLTQKAFQQMNDESTIHLSQQTFLDSTSFYNKALTIDPNSIEALTQLSQVKQMFGDIANSVELAEKSMKLGRNKDELQEICQLYNNAKAQKAALEALKITGM
eukprot:gene20192-26210_t